MLHGYITRFLYGYGFGSITEFFHSLCPSFKYNMQNQTLTISGIFAILSHYLGFSPFIVVAMTIAILVETISGIKASMAKGEHFESFRFSRCVLKVFMWVALVFITNCFKLECEMRGGVLESIGGTFFDITRLLILVYFLVEYIVSIMENIAVLDGKPKTEFITVMQGFFKTFANFITRKERLGK